MRKVKWLLRWIPILLQLVELILALPTTDAILPRETWYTITIAGTPVGYLSEDSGAEPGPDGNRVRTRVESRMTLNRMGSKVEIVNAGSFFETEAGDLLELSIEMRLSSQVVILRGRVEGAELVLESSSGDKPTIRRIPIEGRLLGPEGIRRLSAESLQGTESAVEYRTFMPEVGQIVHCTRTVSAIEPAVINGVETAAILVVEKLTALPLERKLWLDKRGTVVKSVDATPFGEAVSQRATPAEALTLAGGGELPAEQYAGTLVRSNVRLPQARRVEALTLRLVHRKPEQGWPELAFPNQEIQMQGPDFRVVRVRSVAPGTAVGTDVPAAEYRGSNPYIDPENPLIRTAAQEAAGEEADPFRRALRLEAWVADHLRLDMGVVFAPSSELIRERRATCVGFATLLAAMTRAVGMPSRCVMGYVYVDGAWGGHAWTEVWLGGRWVVLDAAVKGPRPADAARLAFAATSLADGPVAFLLGGRPLFGNVDIRIESFRLDGRDHPVPADQPLYRLEGDRYINPGLGFSVTKPAGFNFTDLDRVWPDSTLVALAAPDGRRLSMDQVGWKPHPTPADWARSTLTAVLPGVAIAPGRVGRRPAWVAEGVTQAVAAIPDGSDLWLVRAQGRNASRLLRQILDSVMFPRD